MSVEDIERAAAEIRARSEFPVARPVEPEVDPRPTPFAQAVVPMSVPPDSSQSERAIDARVDRLLGELLTLLAERKAMSENLTATVNRCSALLEQVRKARRLVRAYVEASDGHQTVSEIDAFEELKRWLAEPA